MATEPSAALALEVAPALPVAPGASEPPAPVAIEAPADGPVPALEAPAVEPARPRWTREEREARLAEIRARRQGPASTAAPPTAPEPPATGTDVLL